MFAKARSELGGARRAWPGLPWEISERQRALRRAQIRLGSCEDRSLRFQANDRAMYLPFRRKEASSKTFPPRSGSRLSSVAEDRLSARFDISSIPQLWPRSFL